MLTIEHFEGTKQPEVVAQYNNEGLLDGPFIEFNEDGTVKGWDTYRSGEVFVHRYPIRPLFQRKCVTK